MSNSVPNVSSELARKEMHKAKKQIDDFNEEVQSHNMGDVSALQRSESRQTTEISTKELANNDAMILKPWKKVNSPEKFNERFRKEYEIACQRVRVIFENNESPGDMIELWTKKYPGTPCEFWMIPCNKPIMAPMYLIDQVRSKYYRKLKMDDKAATGSDITGQYTGKLIVDEVIQRIDCHEQSSRRQISFGR